MTANPNSASDEEPASAHTPKNIGALILGCIGVVYGDIGTSPLYAMRESLHAASRDGLERNDVIGVISLLIWTLIIIVSIKYVLLIMRADNRGEGGTLSLVALVQRALDRRPNWLLAVGVVGISLFFGDAIITPAMSVLSAVEGMALVTPAFDDYVVPVTALIIIGLFIVQRKGTAKVAVFFGPIMVLWFVVLGAMGLFHISDDFSILGSLNPWYAGKFIVTNGFASLIVLGSVFLAVTGGEALYADMGHFGRRPIRIAWGLLVFPALTLSYLGQGALVLAHPDKAANPFFLMAPSWALLPLVILATMATVIASQAVISGAFSMMQQATQMGLLPRLEIRHTSEMQAGQIYLPKVNAILALGVLVLVVVFGSSSSLASAYGIAVTGDMFITSILAIVLFLKAWKWPLWQVLAIMVPILLLETLFLGANILKIADGGYVPILIATTMCLLIWTWVRGTHYVQSKAHANSISLPAFIKMLTKSRPVSVPGTAVFLTSDPAMAPSALMHNIKHNRVLHAQNLIVTVKVTTTPSVADVDRPTIERLSDDFVHVTLAFGYMERPNVPRALALTRKRGLKFDIMTTSFFLNRRTFKISSGQGLNFWQERVYLWLTRSASTATDFYCLPSNRVVELGEQLAI